MNGDIIRRTNQSLSLAAIPWRLRRQLAAATTDDTARAVVRANQLRLAARVTRVAMVNTATLSAEEASLVVAAPHAECRLRAIVDAYALLGAGEVTSMRDGL